jgi:DNA-binding transcriptional ArsR family regulator
LSSDKRNAVNDYHVDERICSLPVVERCFARRPVARGAPPPSRAVLERLTRGPAAVSELAQPFKMALPSFVQHLGVLEDCGLVRSNKKGRVRTYALAPQPLKAAENWLSAQRLEWERRLDSLDDFLETLKEQKR